MDLHARHGFGTRHRARMSQLAKCIVTVVRVHYRMIVHGVLTRVRVSRSTKHLRKTVDGRCAPHALFMFRAL